VLTGFAPETGRDASFVGIATASPEALVADLGDALVEFDRYDAPPYVYTSAARPPEIVNADDIRVGPAMLSALLAVALALGLAVAITVTVRDRRRELAILRSLGFTRGDLYASVLWQAVVVILVGLVVGMPIGIASGAVAWRAFAHRLGVPSGGAVPVGWLLVVVAAVVALGLLAAIVPGRSVARLSGPSELRR
jgi:hypothetical protein